MRKKGNPVEKFFPDFLFLRHIPKLWNINFLCAAVRMSAGREKEPAGRRTVAN